MRVRRFMGKISCLLGGSHRLTPLLACWWSETEAEAQEEVAEVWHEPEPKRGTGVVRREVPGATTPDADGAGRWTHRITRCTSGIIARPVRAPFIYVAVHIVKAPIVRWILADVAGFAHVFIKVCILCSQLVAKGESRLSPPLGRHIPIVPQWAVGTTYPQAGVLLYAPVQ